MINKNQLAEFIVKRIGGNQENNLKLIREFEEITEKVEEPKIGYKEDSLEDYLGRVWWSFMDDGFQDGDGNEIRPSHWEIEAMEDVYNEFTDKENDNFVIKCLKSIKNAGYVIELEENTDSFGEFIDSYYDGGDTILDSIVCGNFDSKRFQEDYDKLKHKYFALAVDSVQKEKEE